MRPVATVLAAVLAAACASGGGSSAEAPGAGAGAATQEATALPGDTRMDRIVDLGEGAHSVFGLRIPRGMRPVPGPHLVYRFEGTWDLVAARRFVMRQVETALLDEEPAGYLIRGARVLDPAGEVDPSIRLAVRIFRGRRGGATIDVWAERDRERERPRTAAGFGGTAGAGGGGAGRIAPGSPEARRRAEERRAAFELAERLGRGEAPSPGDADNPFFH